MSDPAPGAEIARRSFQTSDKITLSFLEAGAERGGDKNLTVALVPGWLMPAAIWQRQLEVFGRRHATIALDPRGQGESELAPSGYTAERRAQDIRELLGLALVDSSVGEDPAPGSGGTFKQSLRKDRDKALRDFMHAIFARPRSETEIAELVRGAKRMPLEDSLSLLEYPYERSHWRAIARAFGKPLLYVVTPQYEQQAANLKKHRPATQIEIFRKAGHALFVDEPERFNALIEKFLARLP